MNGVGKRGLKLGYGLLFVMYILFIFLFGIIFVLSKSPESNEHAILYPALIGGVLGIIVSAFAKKPIFEYKKGSRKSPLWFITLMSSFVVFFPASLFVWLHLDDLSFTKLFSFFNNTLFIIFILLSIYLLFANIFKIKIITCLGCFLSCVSYVLAIYWNVKYGLMDEGYYYEIMFTQIMKPFTIISIIIYVVLALTTFVMIFSIFARIPTKNEAKEELKEEKLNS